MSILEIIKTKNHFYSKIGKSSMEQFSYFINRKTQLDKLLSGKERHNFIKDLILDKEKPEDLEIANDSDDDDIFSVEYNERHNMDMDEQKKKYFENIKNPCMFIETRVKKEYQRKYKNKKLKEEIIIRNNSYDNILNNKENKENNNNENKIILEDKHKILAKNELQKIIDSRYNFSYYYHLLHHTDNANYYAENNKNEIIFGPEVNATRYNPKLEYIYPKLIYSPSFKLMNGRFDQEKLAIKLKKNLEQKIKERNDEEEKKKLEKIKQNINTKMNTLFKAPKYYNQKNKDFVKLNEKLREIKEKKRSSSIIVDTPELEKKILGNVDMKKQTERGNIYNNDLRIRNKKYIEDNDINNNELLYKKLMKDIVNSSNSYKENISENKSGTGSNNNETIFTSNALKNTTNKNSNNNGNESNTNNSNNNNLILNNTYLTVKLSNYLRGIKKNKKLRKINLINKNRFPNLFQKNSTHASSLSNLFIFGKNKNKNKSKNNSFNSPNYNSRNLSKLKKENSATSRGPNFNKMLGREYVNKLNLEEEPIHPQLNPNYNSIRPKCIMKVIYSHRPVEKKTNQNFKGLGNDVNFNLDKLYNNYNDHFQAKSFYFDKMTGRSSNSKEQSKLPSFMSNLSNRNSCTNLNEKSLEMNNYSESKMKNPVSSFNQQKSFNCKLKNDVKEKLNELFKDDIKLEQEKIDNNILKNIIGNYTTKNKNKKILIPKQDLMSVSYRAKFKNSLPEFYRINLDLIKKDDNYYKNRIDGITFKSYKSPKEEKEILSERDKKVFLINFNEIN